MAVKITIDYKKALQLLNDKYPKAPPLTLTALYRIMNNKLDNSTVKNHGEGRVPKGFHILHEVAKICECSEDDIKTVTKL